MATGGRFQYRIKHLLLAVAVVAVALSIWSSYVHKPLAVRGAEPSDPTYEQYFSFAEGMKARNILVVEGSFTKGTWLSGSLYLVQRGKITRLNELTVGRSPNRPDDGIWENLTITLALGDKETPKGRVTNLGSRGQSRGTGSCGGIAHTVKVLKSRTMPGRINSTGEAITYIEGDADPIIDRDLTLEEFGQKNQGNFLVVTLRTE